MIKQILPFLTTTALFILPTIAHAQTYQPTNRTPVADSTLGTQVSGTGNNFNITGGLNRGQSLFHSFTDFSVPTGGAANFTNPTGNRDIISRVTGNLFSDINGLVNSNGANFFLINPNGIVFGTNAQLNVGRAFMASTGNGINLVDGSGKTITFGTNPNGDAPLLTVNSNVLFNPNQLIMVGGNGGIINFGTLQTNNPNQYIGLIGGNVGFSGGQIIAPGGRVELGGLAAPGTVTLGTEGNSLRAQLPNNVVRGDISLTNQARVNVEGAGGGDIALNARNIEILGGSQVRGGIGAGLGTAGVVAGDITISATDQIVLSGSNSGITNGVRLNSKGNVGNISINAGSFLLRDGAQISASTFGQGNAGNVKVTTKDAVDLTGQATAIFSRVEQGSVGQGGNIEVDSSSLSIRDSATLTTSSYAQGNSGDITVKAKDLVSLTDANIYSTIEPGGVGNAGSINIKTGSLSLRDGATLQSSSYGQGDAGNITMEVNGAIDLAGSKNGFSSRIFSIINTGTVGNAGSITANTTTLSLRDGAMLRSSTYGQGNAGNVKVTAKNSVSLVGQTYILSGVGPKGVGKGGNIDLTVGSISLRDGAQIETSTFGQGNAGSVKITAKDKVSLNDGGILSAVEPGGVGKGGNIDINAGSLSLQDDAQLITIARESSATQPGGKGDAGNVTVKVTGAVDIGGVKNEFGGSGIFSRVKKGTVGNGGNITIDAGSFSLRDGGLLTAETLGQGNAGTITVNATDFVTIAGKSGKDTSSLLVNSESPTGITGSIFVNSPKITVDGGIVNAKSISGNGGNITIGGQPPTKSGSNQDGKTPEVDLLLLRRGGQISTNAGGTPQAGGNGGNITINSKLIVAAPKENSDISADAVKGRGGNVSINSQGLFGIEFRPLATANSDITASSTFGQQGTVNIKTPGTDPGRDSTILPTVPKDISNQFSHVCSDAYRQNKLIVTGRGGIPPNADDPLTSDVVWQDSRAAIRPPAINKATNHREQLPPPAIGWVFDGKGKVTLISAGTYNLPIGTSIVCPKD